jgi:hypothetical protein
VTALAQRPDAACLPLVEAGLGEILEPFRQDETLAAFHVFAPGGRVVAAQPGGGCTGVIPALLRRQVLLEAADAARLSVGTKDFDNAAFDGAADGAGFCECLPGE